MAKKTKIEDKWEQLFERYDIIGRVEENGIFEIAADEVREYKEPRLMAKFDHESKLPAIFRKNKLSILPISRSKYVISNVSVISTEIATPIAPGVDYWHDEEC